MLHRTRALVAPLPLYLGIEAFYGLVWSTMVTANLVYQALVVGLSPLELVLVGTLLEGVCLVAEVPTGVVADLHSRRLSVVIGIVLIGLGFTLEAGIVAFWAVLAAQVVWGIGATFVSGALEAWLSDETSEQVASGAYLRAAQLSQAASLVGIGVSVALAAAGGPRLPVLVGGIVMAVFGGVLWCLLPEHGFTPAPREHGERTHRAALRTVRAGVGLVRRRRLARALVLASVFAGLASESFDRLSTPHLLRDFSLPALGGVGVVGWFGLLNVASLLVGMGALEVARRRLAHADERRVLRGLICVDACLVAALVVFGLAVDVWLALAAYLAVSTARGVRGPVVTGLLNRELEPSVRATVFSLQSQADAFGQLAGGPLIGLLATAVSLRASFVASALLLAPALVLYVRARREAGAPAFVGSGA
jgi:DHA3 family tetracycline resistance protein-like MFS transporter